MKVNLFSFFFSFAHVEVMMTPLKKRMLRHSIAEDRSSMTQSTTPPPVAEKASTAPSTPTPESGGKLSTDETQKETPKEDEVTVKEEVKESSGNSMPSRIEVNGHDWLVCFLCGWTGVSLSRRIWAKGEAQALWLCPRGWLRPLPWSF